MSRSLRTSRQGPRRRSSLLSFQLVLLCGCDVGDDGVLDRRCVKPTTSELVAFEGVYEMTEFTRNEQGCSVEGASVLTEQAEKFLYVARQAVAGTTELALGSCENSASCREKLNGLSGGAAAYQRSFACSVGDGSLFGGRVTSSSFEADGGCRERAADSFLESLGADVIRIESRTRVGNDVGHDADGGCSSPRATGTSDGKPCAVFEVVTARLIERL